MRTTNGPTTPNSCPAWRRRVHFASTRGPPVSASHRATEWREAHRSGRALSPLNHKGRSAVKGMHRILGHGARAARSACFAAGTLAALVITLASPMRATAAPFTFLQAGFTQSVYGSGSGFFGGVAFAP